MDIPKRALQAEMAHQSIDHYDAGHDENADLHQALLADRRRVSSWTNGSFRRSIFRRFLDMLTTSEYGYIHLKMMEGMPDARRLSDRMDISSGMRLRANEEGDPQQGGGFLRRHDLFRRGLRSPPLAAI